MIIDFTFGYKITGAIPKIFILPNYMADWRMKDGACFAGY